MENDETRLNGTSLILLTRFREGDQLAAESLFARFFDRLTSLTASRLSTRLARRFDPEDIVMSVYRSFFFGVRAGRFTLENRGDLWRLLASITKHKLFRRARHHRAECRSVDIERPLDACEAGRFPGRSFDPSPEAVIAFGDELELTLSQLDSTEQRVVQLRLQGAQLSEIARDTGSSERTVRRKLARVRAVMAERFARADEDLESESSGFRRNTTGGDRRRNVAAPLGSTSLPVQSEAVPDGPLLSHQDVVLQRMIGAGRMGKVYQARLVDESRPIAVKFLRKSLLKQTWLVERFLNEARTVAKLNHPYIVGTHGLGRATGGSYFIVMDFIAGPNLDQIMRTTTVSIEEAVRWSIELCHAIEYAHAQSIIHCDLKPANLLLDQDGSIRVTDFGLARSLTEHTPYAADIEGTAPFMAPEQASRSWGKIGVRADVYGIGAVLYTLLTGRPPWIGRSVTDVLASVTSDASVIPPMELRPELPEPLSEVCRKCLSKAQQDRWPTAHDVRVALAGATA
jgi:eukaryotic-like serine/threonine-protein kinase